MDAHAALLSQSYMQLYERIPKRPMYTPQYVLQYAQMRGTECARCARVKSIPRRLAALMSFAREAHTSKHVAAAVFLYEFLKLRPLEHKNTYAALGVLCGMLDMPHRLRLCEAELKTAMDAAYNGDLMPMFWLIRERSAPMYFYEADA